MQPVEIHGTDSVEGLTVRDTLSGSDRRLDVRGVFIEIGLYPNAELVLDLLETNERGESLVDSRGHRAKAALAAAEYIATLV